MTRCTVGATQLIFEPLDFVAMIGSYYFDPRSECFNSENCLVIRDMEFAR